jgi:deazaflavin-dependent oxidoreductase (nitroreductase family)
MALEGTYEPSPWPPIVDQVALYESSNGTEGTELEGKPCVILWTRGRNSGTIRKSPLMRVRDDAGSYAVVASMGGAPKHPVWYLNLVADPDVSLQDGPALLDYRARVVEGDEKTAWWKRATDVWPAYDEYQTKTDRAIPLVVLEPR